MWTGYSDTGGCRPIWRERRLPGAGRGGGRGPGARLTDAALSRGRKPGRRLARVTFVARVHSLRQQHAAQLALRALPLAHLGQVGRHAERVVVDLALVVFADTAEEGRRRGRGLGQKDPSSVAGYLSPSSAAVSQHPLLIAQMSTEPSRAAHWAPHPGRVGHAPSVSDLCLQPARGSATHHPAPLSLPSDAWGQRGDHQTVTGLSNGSASGALLWGSLHFNWGKGCSSSAGVLAPTPEGTRLCWGHS